MASATPAVTPEPPRLQSWRSNLTVLVERLDGFELAMVRIPAGAFVMGHPRRNWITARTKAPSAWWS